MTSQLVPLAELCQIDRQHVRPTDMDASRLPFVGVEHVVAGNGSIDFDSDSRVGSQKSATFRFDARHVLYGKLRPYLNKVATPAFAGRCSTELIPLLPSDGVDREFLAHLLRRQDTVDFVMAAVTGSRMPRADMKVLLSMRVPLPPLGEQRRIVAILNRAARIEQLRARAAERLREFVPALFVKMFGDPVENPIGWPVEAVGDLVTRGPQNGLYRPMSDYGAGTPILRIDGFLGGQVSHPATWQRVRLDKDTVSRYALEEGDIVINRVNGARRFLGKSAIVPNLEEPAVFESNMMRLQPDRRRVRPGFLIEMLQLPSMKARLCSNAKEINQSSINQTDVKSCVVLTPPLELQEKFCDVADSVRRLTQQAELGSAEGATLLASTIAKLL